MVKLFGVARSRATRNLWLLGEIGMKYEHVPVIQAYRLDDPLAEGAALNTLSPTFLKLCPAGAVPVLQDGDLTIAESVAINLYLAKAYGGDLGPKNACEEARMLQWGFYGVSAVETPAVAILYVHGDGRAKTKDGEVELAVACEKLRRPFKVLNDHLASRDWIVDATPTVADFACCSYLFYPEPFGFSRAEWPHIDRWLDGIAALPGWKHPYDLMPGNPSDRA